MIKFRKWEEARREDPNQRSLFDMPQEDEIEIGDEVKIEIGDEVKYSPNNTKYESEVTGFVADFVNNGDGYNILVPTPGDPGRMIRLWRNKGKFTKTGK